MKNRKLTSVLLLALATFFVVSCSKPAPPLEEPDRFMDVITGVATHISCCSAEIAGKAIVPKNMSTGFTLGISYFTETEYEPIQMEADFFDPEYNYSVNIGSLEPDTTYYYCSYLNHLGEIIYGELKSFKTLAVSSLIQTLDATEINQKEAVLNAFLDLTNCIYDSLEYGFEVTLDGGGTHILKSDNYSGKRFSVKDEFLSIYKKYSVAAYVKLDGHTYKGETKSFTTMPETATVTAEASEIQYKSATISGRLSVQSEGSFSKSAVLYFSSSESTLAGLRSNGTTAKLTLGSDGSYSKTLSVLTSSTAYNFVVIAKVDDVELASQIGNFSTLELPAGSIDLGLSVFWASCNLGASKPTEYGGYYQWAGTKDVSDTGIYLYWNNCPYHTGSNELDGWTKYWGTVYNLEAMDDAAAVALGGNWRIPTDAEWDELSDTFNCSWTWTSIDGVSGYKVQSKKTGYTDKWIFLPAAGFRGNYRLYNVGSDGYYWSSSRYEVGNASAYEMCINSYYVFGDYNSRYYGNSVRPVSE